MWIKRFSEERINVYNLKDASISTINHPVCKQADVDLAVKIANEAFETGPWPTFSGAQRRACLNKLADLLEENVDEAAYFESVCSGRNYQPADNGNTVDCEGV